MTLPGPIPDVERKETGPRESHDGCVHGDFRVPPRRQVTRYGGRSFAGGGLRLLVADTVENECLEEDGKEKDSPAAHTPVDEKNPDVSGLHRGFLRPILQK